MAESGTEYDGDIGRYLFGEMTDDERDTFEEKMFAEDSLFIDVADAENQLVDEYVAGSLSADVAARFERSLDLIPARRENVSNARALREFIEESRPGVTLPEEHPSFLERLAALFTIRTPAFGMATAMAVILLLLATGFLLVRDRRKDADLAKLNDLQSELDQSRQREQELRSAVNSEQETSGDVIDELDQERQRREQIERELQGLKQKPVPGPTTPIVATAFLTPLGGRGGSNTVPEIKLGANTKRVALRLALPDEIDEDERLTVNLNRQRVASGLKPRVSAGKKVLSLTLDPKGLNAGRNQLDVLDEQNRSVGDYQLNIERKQ